MTQAEWSRSIGRKKPLDHDRYNYCILLSIIYKHGGIVFLAVSRSLNSKLDSRLSTVRKDISAEAKRMDFEREMQKALSVIFQNIQALEDKKVEIPNRTKNNRVTRVQQSVHRSVEVQHKLNSLSLSDLRPSYNKRAVSYGLGLNST